MGVTRQQGPPVNRHPRMPVKSPSSRRGPAGSWGPRGGPRELWHPLLAPTQTGRAGPTLSHLTRPRLLPTLDTPCLLLSSSFPQFPATRGPGAPWGVPGRVRLGPYSQVVQGMLGSRRKGARCAPASHRQKATGIPREVHAMQDKCSGDGHSHVQGFGRRRQRKHSLKSCSRGVEELWGRELKSHLGKG